MLHEHRFIIHLIDVIARQDDDIFRRMAFNDVDVLKDSVRSAGIPGAVRNALARGRMSKLSLRSGGKNSSHTANGESGCGPCTGSLRQWADPRIEGVDNAKSMMRDLPPK